MRNVNSARALGITQRPKTRYQYAEELLRDWGIWMAKVVDGLGHSNISTIGRLMEMGAGAVADGSFKPITPNYFPNSETRRAQEANNLILQLPTDMRKALIARYVHEYSPEQAEKHIGIRHGKYYRLINESLAWVTGKKGRDIS